MLIASVLAAALTAAPPFPPHERRGNTALDPSKRRPFYGVAVAIRSGVLLGSGSALVQPAGFGFGIQIHVLPLPIGRTRFGLGFHAGHTLFPERKTYSYDDAIGARRNDRLWTILSHTDLVLGPAIDIPAGPIFVHATVGGGLAIGSLRRPDLDDPTRTEEVAAYNAMIRGGVGIGVPIRGNHGIVLGAAAQQVFSPTRAEAPSTDASGVREKVAPFDLFLETYVGYHVWF